MTTIAPRIARVAVGPPGAVGAALSWQSPLYFTWEIVETAGSTPNTAKVELYNISDASITLLETPGQVLQVLAGETVPGQLFYGDLLPRNVQTKTQRPDRITTLTAKDGGRIIQSGIFSRSYPPGTARSVILSDVLSSQGLAAGYLAPLPERVYPGPLLLHAAASDVLDALYEGEDAHWSIQGGKFQLLALGQPLPGNAIVVSAATGLIGNAERTDKGARWTFLGYDFAPGKLAVLQTNDVNGSFRVSKTTKKGDSDGMIWETQCVGVPL